MVYSQTVTKKQQIKLINTFHYENIVNTFGAGQVMP